MGRDPAKAETSVSPTKIRCQPKLLSNAQVKTCVCSFFFSFLVPTIINPEQDFCLDRTTLKLLPRNEQQSFGDDDDDLILCHIFNSCFGCLNFFEMLPVINCAFVLDSSYSQLCYNFISGSFLLCDYVFVFTFFVASSLRPCSLSFWLIFSFTNDYLGSMSAHNFWECSVELDFSCSYCCNSVLLGGKTATATPPFHLHPQHI